MASIKDQFTFKRISNHFEVDTHIETDKLEIDKIHILSGDTSESDIVVLSYKASPNLSFYNSFGKLIDIDHYLPDFYKQKDAEDASEIISNLKNFKSNTVKSRRSYAKLLRETYEDGAGDLINGLKIKFGLETSRVDLEIFKETIGFIGNDADFKSKLEDYFPTFFDFLTAYILNLQGINNTYVHFTNKNNIIITTLNKRSGISVIIETQDINGDLQPPNKWNIIRTQDAKELEHALVFRTEDVQSFFSNDGDEMTFETDRYHLHDLTDRIEIDSILDNTDNLLSIDIINGCFQTLISDENIIVALSNENEITIINTHNSVVPHKWPKKIVLPDPCRWMQVDENLMLVFAQNIENEVVVYDITSDHPRKLAKLGNFQLGFKVTQEGNLIAKELIGNKLEYIKTNSNEIVFDNETNNFAKIFSDLSHLFKGENVFTKTQFADDITEIPKVKEAVIHSAVEIAKYDFETNIESMLANSNSDYDTLVEIQNKISIARQNIADELMSKAALSGVTFIGQRLKKTINTIVKPSESRVKSMIETLRADYILEEMRTIDSKVDRLEDPSEYKDILNMVRSFEDEVMSMSNDSKSKIIVEFKSIQKELNSIFSNQISNDGNTLFVFVNSEIEQIEKEISETYDFKQLELLMSTNPAAIELMNMIKQPFILQSFAKSKTLSPAGIQKRLYKAVEDRKTELKAEQDRKNAEIHAAKIQLIDMIKDSMGYFVHNHTGGFSNLELSKNAAYRQLQRDIQKLESSFGDLRTAIEMRRRTEKMILEKNRSNLERLVTFEGKYAFVQNDPDLYIDLDYSKMAFAKWSLELIIKKEGGYSATFIRDSDREVYRPTTTDNLRAGRAFEIMDDEIEVFLEQYDKFNEIEDLALINALWTVAKEENKIEEYPQYEVKIFEDNVPTSSVGLKALRCCLEKERLGNKEHTRERAVPKISLEFIDETPFFQSKLKEFLIKAKLQLVSGSGVILLTGPPSTGKSAFLKFVSSIMNREYFEHASDKWQTKNSLVTAIKFGENGPYSVPAGFTKAITTPFSLINIEEIKEWPEALRKSLNPFFAGSKIFTAPDGTKYKIGENILLCAAANLGSMYRQDDEPFTSDFWSRIEVVEYNYAEEEVSREYLSALHSPKMNKIATMQDLTQDYFKRYLAPKSSEERAAYYAQQLIEFILLPKADESIKRENLQNYIQEYFTNALSEPSKNYNPEEAVKVALKRLPDLQGYSAREFFDLYDHFVNGKSLNIYKLSSLQTKDPKRYLQLKIIMLCLRYIEGCLRKLRTLFYSSAGQTEIEGTNREFIKCVYLLGLMGRPY